MEIDRTFEKRGNLYVPEYRGPRWCPYWPGQRGGFKFGSSWTLSSNNIGAAGYGVASKSATFPFTVNAGSLLVGFFNWQASTLTVSDNVNTGNWTPVGSPVGGALNLQAFYFFPSKSGTITITAALGTGTTTIEFVALEYRGGVGAYVDGSNGAALTTTTLSTGNFTSSGYGDLIVFAALGNARYPTQSNSGYTSQVSYANNSYNLISDNSSVAPGINNLTASSNGSAMTLYLAAVAFTANFPNGWRMCSDPAQDNPRIDEGMILA